MRVSPHGPHLIQLAGRIVNCYLVREDDGLTLVDCGVRGSERAILAAAREARQRVRRITVTHAHWDHVGSLAALRRELPDAEVLVGRRESRILAGDYALQDDEPAGKLRKVVYRRPEVQPNRLLEPGDRVGSLEVVDAKGHTPGQIGLLDTRDRTLICADAYINVGRPFVCSQFALRFPAPALLGTWHGPTAVTSARALRALSPVRLASGHGRVIDEPVPAMDEALERAG